MAYSGILRRQNLNAAKAVVMALREGGRYFMNEKQYRDTIMCGKGYRQGASLSYGLPQNYDPITVYLEKNGLVTKTSVNGFNIYTITQKGYRSKIENLFEVPSVIQRGQVNTAIALCEQLNKYMDPDKFAEYITDNRTLPFKGATRTKFIELFKFWAGETDSPEDTFDVVLGKMKNVRILG